MQKKYSSKEDIISTIKEWASPALIGLVGILLWRDVTEMRSDVKLLLTQQSADRVKIDQLEYDVKMLKTHLYSSSKNNSNGNSQQPQFFRLNDFAILNKQEDVQSEPEKPKK
jgi:hypothetical protein